MNDWHRIDLTIYMWTDDPDEIVTVADAAMQKIEDEYPVHSVSRDVSPTAMSDSEVVEYMS